MGIVLRALAPSPAAGDPNNSKRLHVLMEAFFDDPRPGFLCERGIVMAQNTAMAVLLEQGVSSSELLKQARDCALAGRKFMDLRTPAGRYQVRLYSVGPNGEACVGFVERRTASPLTLTQREEDVLGGVLRGWTNAAIAGQLSISVETVKGHVRRLLRKSGARRRGELRRGGFLAGSPVSFEAA